MDKDETRKWLDDLRKRLMETHSAEELEAMKVKIDVLETTMRMLGGHDDMHDDDTDDVGHHHHQHHQSVFAGGLEDKK